MPSSTLINRYNGIVYQPAVTPNGRKLTLTEEQTIVQYILDLNARGFLPRKYKVKDIANKLLAKRGGELIGKKWVDRFITYIDKLKIAFN